MKGFLLAVLILIVFLFLTYCSPVIEDKISTQGQLKRPILRSHSKDPMEPLRKLAQKRGNKLFTKSNEPSFNRAKSKVVKTTTRKEVDGLTTVKPMVTTSENTTSIMMMQLSSASSIEAASMPTILSQAEPIATVATDSSPMAVKTAKLEKKKKMHEHELFPVYPDAHDPIIVPDYHYEMDQFNYPRYQIIDPLPPLDQIYPWDYGSWAGNQYSAWDNSYWSAVYEDKKRSSKSRKCKNEKKNKTVVKNKNIEVLDKVEPQKATTESMKTTNTETTSTDDELWNEIMNLLEAHRSQMKVETDVSLKKRLAQWLKEVLAEFFENSELRENNANAGGLYS